MSDRQFTTENVVNVARTSLGDTLRSVVYLTPSQFDVHYVRWDLYGSTDEARELKSLLAETEKVGFAERPSEP